MKKTSIHRKIATTALLCSTFWTSVSFAQQVPAETDAASTAQEETSGSAIEDTQDIVVVGSQIKGSSVTDALPVTVVSPAQIATTAAVSGDELFRSIPQMGDVTFNSSYIPNSSNSARGDVGSVNLRNLGPGNTLVLLNGRRVVAHPVSQADENLVPVISYNTNAIPVGGVQRLEVLRDGAAAIYGTNAVAGVVNTVLRNDYDGASLDAQYGFAEGTHLKEITVNGGIGHNFGENRGNISLYGSYMHRSALEAQDQDFTASSDRRPLFVGTRFEGVTNLDSREARSGWASLATPTAFGTVRQNGVALTSAAGLFHIQPGTNAGCQAALGNGICIDDGAIATGGVDRNLRLDVPAAYNTSIMPKIDRLNLFLTGRYEVTDDVEIFGEAGLYLAKSKAIQSPSGTLAAGPISIPASNYWNPFGPVTFADGTVNPNRLQGLNIPAEGLPVTIRSYLFSDAGQNNVIVKNNQYRLLGGIRFEAFGFDWESAALYSAARVHDQSDGISATLLQQQLALSTPDAYNPFNGGNLANPSLADTAMSSQAALDAIRIKTNRISKSTLALVDLKGSKSDLIELPGGSVGLAVGLELRRETQIDDRDPRVDGTTSFTDQVTGIFYPSDLIGTSQTPDTKGARTVASAYAELALPLVSPEMEIPLIRKLEVQVAGRFENYSDVGSVAKPKVAAAWDLFDGVRLRGSWAKGFKAPNLELVNATVVSRTNNRTDYIRCEARSRLPTNNPLYIDSFANCGESFNTLAMRAGNKNLKPEKSDTWSAGIVLEPQFIPSDFGQFVFTVDYWNIRQKGIVGLFGEGNAIILDYYDRVTGGTNPDVVRADPTADDIALFTAAGMDPVGQVLYVNDQYRNLLPQKASGIDFGMNWQVRDTGIGDFSLDLNIAYLRKFYRQPSPEIAELLAARDEGIINPGTTITQGGTLVRQDSRPRWKGSASLTWSYENFQIGAFTSYVGSVEDNDLIDNEGMPWLIDSSMTGNLYFQFKIPEDGKDRYRLRLGVRNLTNEKPPLSSGGFNGLLYNPYGRYWYASVRADF